MAELTNEHQIQSKDTRKEYATDEAGMMADAKEYAKRDMSTIFKVLEKVGIKPVTPEEMTKAPGEMSIELITKAVVAVKYEQIDKARNSRPVWERYLD